MKVNYTQKYFSRKNKKIVIKFDEYNRDVMYEEMYLDSIMEAIKEDPWWFLNND